MDTFNTKQEAASWLRRRNPDADINDGPMWRSATFIQWWLAGKRERYRRLSADYMEQVARDARLDAISPRMEPGSRIWSCVNSYGAGEANTRLRGVRLQVTVGEGLTTAFYVNGRPVSKSQLQEAINHLLAE